MSTTTSNNDMNYDDPRLDAVNEEYDTKISESDKTYQDMIDGYDTVVNSQIQASKDWADEQTKLQNEQTDFTIEQINQQKEQAEKDYIKEQSGAYKDWQKQSDKYGVNAEQMAASGMANTGYSESSQVAMYNQYQSRVAVARDAFERSVTAYDNMIKEAKLQNSSILAEIAHNALVEQNQLILTGLQYKNPLILEKASKKLELESMRNEEWYNVLEQINAEGDSDEDDGDNDAIIIKYPTDNGTPKSGGRPDQIQQVGIAEPVEEKNTSESSDETSESTGDKTTEKTSEEYPVNTEYYRGKKNSDAEIYGTFKNGYQPKGISDHGKLKATGETTTFTTTTLSGENKTVTQKVWEAEDGTWWRWDGRSNKYIEMTGDDLNSIVALGYGSLSPAQLAKLVSEGKVTYTLKKGTRYYRRTAIEGYAPPKASTKHKDSASTSGAGLTDASKTSSKISRRFLQ